MSEDFPTSPAKRQRTMSPEETVHAKENSSAPETIETTNPVTSNGQTENLKDFQMEANNNFLDVLMQNVEAESSPQPQVNGSSTDVVPVEPIPIQPDLQTTLEKPAEEPPSHIVGKEEEQKLNGDVDVEPSNTVTPIQNDSTTSSASPILENDTTASAELKEGQTDTQEPVPVISISQDIPLLDATISTEVDVEDTVAPVDTNPEGAEWEIDSSPYQSSTDSGSSDSSSTDSDDDDEDGDEDADGDYAMLDPEEQARILMQGDGGSDDEGGNSKQKGDNSGLRTANERAEEIIPKPDITVTEDMKVEKLGTVEAIVESTVLIKAATSGEYQVLESGSLLCLADRSVIGVVAETLGRVEQPLYTVRFTNDEAIADAGVSTPGTEIYYVLPHSTFVFTQPLKGVKGSDASNFHDEEVGDDEMEFSDDEAEAEHKRLLKLKRQGRRDDGGRGRGSSGGRGGRHRGNRQGSVISQPETNGTAAASSSLNYDDAGDNDYTPLTRPNNLHEMMGQDDPREEPSTVHHQPAALPSSRGRGHNQGFRGRGDRGRRGGGYRGGRGGFNQHQNHYQDNSHHQQQNSYTNGYHNQAYSQYQSQSMGPPQPVFPYPTQHHQYPYSTLTPPSAPSITPQNGGGPFSGTPFSPSPISPLPMSQFQFGAFPPPPPPPPQYGSAQTYAGNRNNYQSANGYAGNSWQGSNQAATSQVQRQLDELKRMQQQG